MTTEEKLENEIRKIKNDDLLVDAILLYCNQEHEQKQILTFIKANNPNASDLLLFASYLGIKSGNCEGEILHEIAL